MSGFKDHFSDRAAGYAEYRPHYPPALASWLAGISPRRDRAWDAGCGSGQLSTLLADHFDRVIATDASEAQIARAVSHPRVEYRAEPAEKTTIELGTIDLVTVAQAAHWIDLPTFYGEARRVASPAAMIAMIAYEKVIVDPAVDDVIDAFYSGTLAGWWPPERRHVETGYRFLDFPFDAIETPSLEMEERWSVDQFLGYVGTWSAVRALEKAEGGAKRAEFDARLRAAWGESIRDVRWPIAMRVGRLSG